MPRGLFTGDPVKLQTNDGGDRFREVRQRPPVVDAAGTILLARVLLGERLTAVSRFSGFASLLPRSA